MPLRGINILTHHSWGLHHKMGEPRQTVVAANTPAAAGITLITVRKHSEKAGLQEIDSLLDGSSVSGARYDYCRAFLYIRDGEITYRRSAIMNSHLCC